ncbi:MAG: hypothetical protein ABI397_02010 [Candidatus Saccharimonas sp.]
MSDHKEMSFYYGTMGSRKTLGLMLDQYRREDEFGHETLIIKPGADKKAGNNIQTRAFGGEKRAARVMAESDEASEFVLDQIRQQPGEARDITVYLDEVNFFTPEQILSLRKNIVDKDIADIKMYGLLIDAFGKFFPGSEPAIRYADHIIQLESTCQNDGCDRPANRNARIVNGSIIRGGPQVAIDGIDAHYMALCHHDYDIGIISPSKGSAPTSASLSEIETN